MQKWKGKFVLWNTSVSQNYIPKLIKKIVYQLTPYTNLENNSDWK